MNDLRTADEGICECGLAWSYHDGRLRDPSEYRPRYPKTIVITEEQLAAIAALRTRPNRMGSPVDAYMEGVGDALRILRELRR